MGLDWANDFYNCIHLDIVSNNNSDCVVALIRSVGCLTLAKSDGSGFDWDTLWSCWRTQPPPIQHAWMFGNSGLLFHLKDAMENYPKEVQDEMFGHAPKDVQKYFGYTSKKTLKAKTKKKPTHNQEYRSYLLDKIRGISA